MEGENRFARFWLSPYDADRLVGPQVLNEPRGVVFGSEGELVSRLARESSHECASARSVLEAVAVFRRCER